MLGAGARSLTAVFDLPLTANSDMTHHVLGKGAYGWGRSPDTPVRIQFRKDHSRKKFSGRRPTPHAVTSGDVVQPCGRHTVSIFAGSQSRARSSILGARSIGNALPSLYRH